MVKVVEPSPEWAARERIKARLEGLGIGELVVIEQIVERLHLGRARYGWLRPSADARDFRREAAEEALDCSVYLGALLVKGAS